MAGEDEAALRELLDRHFADLWRFARRRVGSADDADDVVAETFAVAWRRRHRVPGGEDARLWLFGVARHVVANHRRAERRRHRLHLRLRSLRVDAAVTATATAADAEAPPGLRAAFAALSDAEREVVIMRHWDHLAVHEIATLLGCTPNAVSLRLHKARRRLAQLLAGKDAGALGQVPGDPDAGRGPRHA